MRLDIKEFRLKNLKYGVIKIITDNYNKIIIKGHDGYCFINSQTDTSNRYYCVFYFYFSPNNIQLKNSSKKDVVLECMDINNNIYSLPISDFERDTYQITVQINNISRLSAGELFQNLYLVNNWTI